MSAIDTQSQLDRKSERAIPGRATATPTRPVGIDLHVLPNEPASNGCDDGCNCVGCSGPTSFANAATCAMVGASTKSAQPKSLRSRLTMQGFYWSITFIAAIISMPTLIELMPITWRDWTASNILSTSRAPIIATLIATLFTLGFVHKLGRDKLKGGCAMLRRLGPAMILGVAWSILPSFAGVMLVLNMEPISVFLIGDGSSTAQLILGVGIYTAAFIILAGFGCLPTVSQAILAGYTFGIALGLPAALIGFGGASLIGYELVQRVARQRVEQELNKSQKAIMVRDALLTASTRRAILIVSLLRASPSAPFALTNLFLGCLGVSRGVFVIGTIIGMTPRTLAAVIIGVSFTGWNGGFDQPRWVVVAGIVATIGALIVISKAAASALFKVSNQQSQEATAPLPQPAS